MSFLWWSCGASLVQHGYRWEEIDVDVAVAHGRSRCRDFEISADDYRDGILMGKVFHSGALGLPQLEKV